MSEAKVDMDTAVAEEPVTAQDRESQLTSIIGVFREVYFLAGFSLSEADKLVGRVPWYQASEEEGCSEDVGYLCRN